MDKVTQLIRPPQHVIDHLSKEPSVATKDVVGFCDSLSGLTEPEGLNLLDDLRDRRSWNLATYMACAESLDYARSPG